MSRLEEHDRFLQAHRFWAWGLAVWVALLTLVLAELLRYGLDALARKVTEELQ